MRAISKLRTSVGRRNWCLQKQATETFHQKRTSLVRIQGSVLRREALFDWLCDAELIDYPQPRPIALSSRYLSCHGAIGKESRSKGQGSASNRSSLVSGL